MDTDVKKETGYYICVWISFIKTVVGIKERFLLSTTQRACGHRCLGPWGLQFTSSGVGPENMNFSPVSRYYHEAAGFWESLLGAGREAQPKSWNCVSFGELAEDSRLGEWAASQVAHDRLLQRDKREASYIHRSFCSKNPVVRTSKDHC